MLINFKKNNHFNRLFLLIIAVGILTITSCKKDVSIETPQEKDVVIQNAELQAAIDKLSTYMNENKTASLLDIPEQDRKNFIAEQKRSTPLSTRSDEQFDYEMDELFNNEDYIHQRAYNQQLVLAAINPADYVCNPTIFSDHVNGIVASLLKKVPSQVVNFVLSFGDVPFIDAIYFNSDPSDDTFGYYGEYTKTVKDVASGLNKFWNINRGNEIITLGAHGTVFKDVNKVATIIRNFYTKRGPDGKPAPIPSAEALDIARQLNTIIGSKEFGEYNFPLLTLNAFASSGSIQARIAPRTVMGDGIMAVYQQMGFGNVSSIFVMAHEFGHHAQTFDGLFPANFQYGNPEEDRRLELMADALAGYYVMHKKGCALAPSKINYILSPVNMIGDCSFTQAGHHGTPNQRRNAGLFGARTALYGADNSRILSTREFAALFNAEYPTIIAPDAR
jgi:hypothetical protein